jgi:hypothetical protein
MELKKGCVYFFRHVGLTPVKIGFSLNESPIDRFNQFKTYAPYGSEILGFIIISNAKEIESLLHKKYANKRLNGEWFELTEKDVENEVNFYTNVSIIEERNEFQIAWANHINKRNDLLDKNFYFLNKDRDKKDTFLKMFKVNKKLNRTHTALLLGVTRKTICSWIKELNNLKS